MSESLSDKYSNIKIFIPDWDGNKNFIQFTDSQGKEIFLESKVNLGRLLSKNWYIQIKEMPNPDDLEEVKEPNRREESLSKLVSEERSKIYVWEDQANPPLNNGGENLESFKLYDKSNLLIPEGKAYAGFVKVAKALDINKFPKRGELEKILLNDEEACNLIVSKYLNQNGVNKDFLPKENSDYTIKILTEFSKNPKDSDLQKKVINQLEDVKSECLEKQRIGNLGAKLKDSIPQQNSSIPEGSDVRASVQDSRNEQGFGKMEKEIDFTSKDGNTKGTGKASTTILPDGKKTETETVRTSTFKGEDGSTSNTQTTSRSSYSSYSSKEINPNKAEDYKEFQTTKVFGNFGASNPNNNVFEGSKLFSNTDDFFKPNKDFFGGFSDIFRGQFPNTSSTPTSSSSSSSYTKKTTSETTVNGEQTEYSKKTESRSTSSSNKDGKDGATTPTR